MTKLEMLIQSVEARYDKHPEIYYYNLSCSLLNIYKGRCNLFIVSNNTKLEQELTIKHDRAIMEGNLIINDEMFYKNFNTLFNNKFERPGKIEIFIRDILKINNQGILQIKDEIKTEIINFKFYLPLL